MKLLHVLAVSVLICTVGVLACAAPAPRARKAPAPAKMKGSPESEGRQITELLADAPRISPRALSRVKAPTTRRSMVRSMLSIPATRSLLSKAAAAKGFSADELTTRSLGGTRPASESIAGSAVLSRLQTVRVENPVDAFDWDAGVRFSPAFPGPSYEVGANTIRTGAMQASGLSLPMGMTLRDMYERDFMVLRPGHNLVYICVELPSEPATYTLKLHLAPADGTTIADWLAGRPASESIGFGILHETGYAEPTLEPLADNTGFLAVTNLTPDNRNLGSADRERTGMRQVDCVIDIVVDSCVSTGAASGGPAAAFGGVTLMRW